MAITPIENEAVAEAPVMESPEASPDAPAPDYVPRNRVTTYEEGADAEPKKTLGAALTEFIGLDKRGKRAFMDDLQRDDPAKYLKLARAYNQHMDAQQIAASLDNVVTIEDQLGAEYDAEAGKGLPFTTRFDLGRSSTAEDKLAKVLAKGYDAQLATDLDGNTHVYWRNKGSNEPYRLADPRGLDTGDVGEVLGRDVVTVETAATLGELALTGGRSAVKPALKKAWVVGKTAAAALTGRGIDVGIEEVRGYESRAWDAIAVDLGISAGGAAAGELLSGTITKVMNFATRRGTKAPTDEARREIVDIIESDPHLKELGFGQDPEGFINLLRSRFKQFDASLRQQEVEQAGGLAESIRSMARSDEELLSDLDDHALQSLQDSLTAEAEARIRKSIGLPDAPMSRDAAGKQVQRGLFDPGKEDSFRSVATERENRRWARVENLAHEDMYFDLNRMKPIIEKLRREYSVPGKGGTTVTTKTDLPKEIESILDRLEMVDGGRVPGQVEIFQKRQAVDENGDLIFEVDGSPVLENVSAGYQSGFEFIKNLREDLGQFFGHDNVLSDVHEGAARELWGGFRDVLENPVGPASQPFKTALTKANRATQFKHDILDANSMVRLAKSDNPKVILDTIERGGLGFKNLQTMKRVMPQDRWEKLSTGMKSDLVNNPSKIDSFFKSGIGADNKSLNLFFKEPEIRALKTFSANIKKIDGNVLAKTLRDQSELSLRADDILAKSTPQDLRDISRLGGPGAKNELRAAVTESILRKASVDEFGQRVYKPKIIGKNINELFDDKEMALKMKALLDPAAIKALKDQSKVASWLAGAAQEGGGASMAAGATAGKATDVTNPAGMIGAYFQSRSIQFMSRTLNSPKFLSYMNNSAEPFGENQLTRTASVMISSFAARQTKERD